MFLVRFVGFLSGEKAVNFTARSRPKAVGEAAEPGRKLCLAQLTIVMVEMKLFFDGVDNGNGSHNCGGGFLAILVIKSWRASPKSRSHPGQVCQIK